MLGIIAFCGGLVVGFVAGTIVACLVLGDDDDDRHDDHRDRLRRP